MKTKTLILVTLLFLAIGCGKELSLPQLPASQPEKPTVAIVQPTTQTIDPSACAMANDALAVHTTQQYWSALHGRYIDVTVNGTVTCTNGAVDLFTLTKWQWTTYCLNNPDFQFGPAVSLCNVNVETLTLDDQGFHLDTGITGIPSYDPASDVVHTLDPGLYTESD